MNTTGFILGGLFTVMLGWLTWQLISAPVGHETPGVGFVRDETPQQTHARCMRCVHNILFVAACIGLAFVAAVLLVGAL